MKKQLIVLLLALLPASLWAAGTSYPLDDFKANFDDKASLQRGAKLFVSYCMGCHSAKFSRFERVADDLGIPHEIALENLVFDTDQKIGSLMTIGMDGKSAKAWFGAAPPDLTLVSRARKPEWVYTYLRTFYVDPSRPWGVNNKVFPNVGMPHVFEELQGQQVCSGDHCERLLHVKGTGSMTPAEFDDAMYDLVNFLDYIAEPMKSDRITIGWWVMLYLVVLLFFVVLLNREYWKDIH